MRPQKSLKARALDLLSRREYSRTELKKKLMQAHQPPEEADEFALAEALTQHETEVEAILTEFADLNWQSDERYVESFINAKSQQYGSRRLQESLKQKGIEADLFQQFRPAAEVELSTAIAAVRKKFKKPPESLADKHKQMRFLAYRGFDFDLVNKAISAWDDWSEED
ncbi:recombination regulator RecX [Neisseriaceae bacterium CLB008]|nr:recombination regulator RecX [Neisseriaceae bacterium]